jgi:hypothetical protein
MLFHNLPSPFWGKKKLIKKRGKFIIIIIGYTLNNFTPHNTKMMEKIIISIFFKIFEKKRNYWFVNVETNPRLRCIHRKFESKII